MHEAFIKGRSIEFAFVHGNLAKISELFLFNHQNVPQFHKTRKGHAVLQKQGEHIKRTN